ncbi:hypothetical protein CPB83DRAFT_867745 [Crepidotus variabilis]|uniref:Uncharacterized protein n=1 Tax=Crepidotus variabilis TaxID=179855 RepID=A0A9P6JT08_9AGAR|nr:hypothetical protein CPB83DRAFT_867745 [Crepidotus variabilis]
MQKSLQAEGTTLMHSLDEMRPKIVELTGEKLDLSEKVGNLDRALQSRDASIAQLESDLDETKDHLMQSERVWKEKLAQQEKRNNDSQNGAADVQKAYNELQEELDTALASLRSLESQRANQHQDAARRLEEIERLTTQSRTQSEEFDSLQRELESRRKSHDEELEFLERAHNEIELLRGELSARDEEINHLREAANTPTTDAPRSLDDEMLNSLRQQHALELSSATSQIRALENSIFDKDSAIHSLQKQINSLQEQTLRPKSPARVPSRPFSPTSHNNSQNELRRSSFGHNRPNLPSPLARTVFDQAMTPKTMHKRKVSLSMLKARMNSESKVVGSQSSSRAMSPVLSEGSNSRPSSALGHRHHAHRSQFLDESHVFWCHSCSGDLVIL